MDQFARAIDPDASLRKTRQQNIKDALSQIIDSRAKDRLDSPLHLAGYLLNPYYYYRDDEAQKDPACMTAILTCIEAFFSDNFHVQHLIHTKKRNRLDAARMSHLVYVQFNSKLFDKKKKMKEKCDVLIANDASMAQGWIVEGGDDEEELSQDSNITNEEIGEVTRRNVRELDEDDFESEDEANDDENLTFDF
ncbi:hypothetical protein DCAR_0727350 [Daucus carota subsp. sativus]|uniref:Uncharacterized protein n=1 Tax=Daucus carota subsp. sativus TaxID=79200 RepID=A0AAF0XHI5_DAUCS|nr:hypothetical protein DCAR_0727350 [Daucus carota subsp. sativus]